MGNYQSIFYRVHPDLFSSTGDNGTEFADRKAIAKALKTKFFFTHPYSSWEKELIENTNKLVRQYIPEKANLDDFNHQQIKQIQYKIKNRPGERLNFYSPKEIFFLNLQNADLHSVVESTGLDFYLTRLENPCFSCNFAVKNSK